MGSAWFDCIDPDAADFYNPKSSKSFRRESLNDTLHRLDRLLELLETDYQWTRDRIFTLGFSMGGTTALEWGLRTPGLGGVISIAGGLIEERKYDPVASVRVHSATGLPSALCTVGSKDDPARVEWVKQSATIYSSLGGAMDIKVIPNKGHSMELTEPEVRILMEFLSQRMKHDSTLADSTST